MDMARAMANNVVHEAVAGSTARIDSTDHKFRPDCQACRVGKSSLCSKVADERLERLRGMSRSTLFAKDSILATQDSELEKVFIIVDGIIKLYQILPDGRRQIIGFLGPGDLLGSIKRNASVHSTAEAVTDVVACTFERGAFLEFLHESPDLMFELLINATDEIESQHDHVILLGCKRPHERLAAFLLLMQQRWPVARGNGESAHIPMARADIADYLGLTVETVSRTFTRFKKLGFIALPRTNLVQFRDLAALYNVAGLTELPARGTSMGL
jgi:CRP/FNR family transcriptional regulator